MKHAPFYILIIAMFVFPLVGCNKPVANQVTANLGSGSTQVWFDFPLDGSEMPMGTYDLVSHSADNGGISQVEWSINGSVVASEPVGEAANTIENLSEFHQSWTPAEPGKYVLNVRAQSANGNWTIPAKADVTILGEITPTVTNTSTSTPTKTSTPTPTETLTITPMVNSELKLLEMSRSSDEFYYGTCSPNSISFSIRASIPDKVKYMFLFYKLQDRNSGEKTPNNDGLPMNKTGKDTWTISLKYNQLNNYNKFDESWFIYQFVSQGPNKELTRSAASGNLKYTTCGSGNEPVQIISITPTSELPIINPGE